MTIARLLSLLALAFALVPSALQALARDSILTVTAMSSATVKADRAIFYLTVEGTAESATEAMTRAEARVPAVLAALRGLGEGVTIDSPIPGHIGPANPRGYPSPSPTPSYTSRVLVRVTFTRLELLQRAAAAALDAGATAASAVIYESADEQAVRSRIRNEALAAARAEAAATAAAMGARLGGLADVSVNIMDRQRFGPNLVNLEPGFNPQSPTPDVTVTTQVTVRYRLAP